MLDPVVPTAPFDLVLLDRDGTLNVRVPDGYVTSPDGLIMLAGAAEAVARFTRAGCRTVLVTNQRAIARGLMSVADLDAVHHRLGQELSAVGGRLDATAVCPHDVGECGCRKPLDGLFREALARAPWARPGRCLMIGDMPSDLIPAEALGIPTLRVGPDQPFGVMVDRVLGHQPG